jgi:hypothetical protein
MHGLNTIKRLNKTEQDFIDYILATPVKDVNLLHVWREWKQTDRDKYNEAKKLGEATL